MAAFFDWNVRNWFIQSSALIAIGITMNKRNRMSILIGSGLAVVLSQAAIAASVQSVNALADSFGDGTRLTKVIVHYDEPITQQSLASGSFSVKGQSIVNSYVSQSADGKTRDSNGQYVVLMLDSQARSALIYSTNPQLNGQHAMGHGMPPKMKPDFKAGHPPKMGFHAPAIKDYQVSVTQNLPLANPQGKAVSASKNVYQSSHVTNVSASRFTVHTFVDKATGKILRYNLYVPKNYDPKKSYPLVFFGHDAGATSSDPRVTLWQGLGATVWTSADNQARHPSFVVAPQYDAEVAGDHSKDNVAVPLTKDLIQSLEKHYAIDSHRIYATGQSGGCMLSLAMNIKYPHLFAASYLVAGQWDANKTAVMAHKPLWIVVSQGDTKAYPGMNASVKVWKQHGAKVAEAVWNGRANEKEVASLAKQMLAKPVNIRYVTLMKGTVVPKDQGDDSGSNHLNTWRIAYTYQPIIDWLFQQSSK